MKAAGLPLLFLAALGSLPGEDVIAPVAARTSDRVGQEIRATLPKFSPPASPVLDQPKDATPDPDVLSLPTVTVKEKRPPTHNPDGWLTEKSVQQKALAAYKTSMTDLEWALNSWYIPLISPPASVRARSAYRAEKFRSEVGRLADLIDRIGTQAPTASAVLRQELVNLTQGRPPGSK
jgi:hypothetical protein